MITNPDFNKHYRAIRDGRGVVELSNWSSLVLQGRDRQRFLHNFCTNNIVDLAAGASREIFVTDVKGHVLGHGIVQCRSDELLFVGAGQQAARLAAHLDRYLIREDVQLRDTTAERRLFLVGRQELPMDAGDAIPWDIVSRGRHRIVDIRSNELAAFRDKLRGELHIEASDASFAAVRLEVEMPLYGVDFDERNLPQEVDRDRQAISFNKGCYLGQETVARIDALGHVNQKLVLVAFSNGAAPTANLSLQLAGRVVGRVTSAAFSPLVGAPLAFAMVRREANSLGTQLQSEAGDCEIVAPPLGA